MSDWARTRRLSCRVVLSSDEPLTGDLHLQPLGSPEHPVETPLEMLNRPERFFALAVDDDVRLISKDAVRAVAVERDQMESHPLARRVEVQLRTDDGTDYRGTVEIELAPPSNRLLDFLNQPEPFFALLADDQSWCLNRHRLLWVRPL